MSTPFIDHNEPPDLSEINTRPGMTFGLPSAPASIGIESPLVNAPVVAYRVNGDIIHGLLERFNIANGRLAIHEQDGARVAIKFEELRFLVFPHSLRPSSDSGIDADHGESGGETPLSKVFELVFKDGKKFHASAKVILIDPVGLHIFLDKANGHVCRVFVPKNTLSKYSFDASLGKGLVEHRALNTDHDHIKTQPHPVQTKSTAHKETHGRLKLASPTNPEPGSILVFPAATSSSELIERLERKWQLPTHTLGELLLAQNIITEDQLHDAMAYQQRQPNKRIGEILIQQGVATADEIYSTLAFKLGLHFVKLESFDIDIKALSYFPMDLAVRFHVIPLFIHDNQLVVAMSDPTNNDACKMVEFVTQHHVEAVMAHDEDIATAIDRYYRSQEDDEVIEEFIGHADTHNDNEDEIERQSKQKPIVRLVQNMIIEGVNRRASDIHIRPGEESVDIILRIDGSLIPIRNFKKPMLSAVISRIKIICSMDISEHRIPQDGRASVNLHGNKVDLRISVMPTINGESVVIRILDSMAGLRSIDQLGFGNRDFSIFKDMISHSYGILLVTGPTGSGKSTTLYAALEHIRKSNVNIITAEDPVEYHIDGIEQMQVNHQIDYSFSRILRNILRHDPDVIMVGEIRDQETAKIAIESALTGHFVLSTLHTNSAAVTVTRLLEMGVEPYLINDTLLGVLAQRLVRANCPDCIDVEEVAPSVYQALNIDKREKFYRGKGCRNCNHTGYKGRLAVYELLQMNREIRSHVLKEVSADIIHAEAITGGMIPLTQNAVFAARERKTSLAEVYRVRLE